MTVLSFSKAHSCDLLYLRSLSGGWVAQPIAGGRGGGSHTQHNVKDADTLQQAIIARSFTYIRQAA